MKNLEEKKLLVKMARMLGEPVDPELLESIKREEQLTEALFGKKNEEPVLVEVVPEPVEEIVVEAIIEPLPAQEEKPAETGVQRLNVPDPEEKNKVAQTAKYLDKLQKMPPSQFKDAEMEAIRKTVAELLNRVNTLSFGGGGTGVVRIWDTDDLDRGSAADGLFVKYDGVNHMFTFDTAGNGAQGPTGPTGPSGPQGPAGSNGAQGPTGNVGAQGPQGPQGPAGSNGAQGPTGNVGAQGPQGPQGPAGSNGAQGPQGVTGAQGPQGPSGASVTGAQGPQGPSGPSGAQGPSGPANTTTGSWTLSPGTNTVSLTVPPNGTYSIWVRGNIPSGIVSYTATVVVTNTNVPVLGSSYGWYYVDGNNLVLTAIPTQIIGTVNGISTATVSTTTANVFTFGITNNSGTSQVVNWGYTTL